MVLCGEHTEIPNDHVFRGEQNTYRLDSLIDTNIQIQVLKIDVEGFEYYALKGGSELFEQKRVKYLVILFLFQMTEFNKELIQSKSIEPRKYIEMLVNWGFKISTIGFDGPYLEIIKGNEASNFKNSQDIFCTLED